MNGLRFVPPARLVLALGSAAGLLVGVTTGALAGAASKTREVSGSSRTLLEATHLPPLLRAPGEQVELSYEAFCVGDGGEDDPCAVDGAVFVREGHEGPFSALELEPSVSAAGRQLVARVPGSFAEPTGDVEYYAVLEAADGQAGLTIPPGGGAAPHLSSLLHEEVEVDLGRHVFGKGRSADARVAAAAWGSDADDVGLEEGRNLSPIGATAFDVNASGTIYVLDEANRRVLRWNRGSKSPARIPVSVFGSLADMEVAPDGTIYVLETVGRPGGNPLVRRFDGDGRELERVEIAERTASQIRMGTGGPVVLQQPSHQWMPVSAEGVMAGAATQRRNGSVGRPLPAGDDVVVLRRENEVRVALTRRGGARRTWRIHSETALGEVQLAEPLGNRLVLVVRAYTDTETEFLVLILDGRGLVEGIPLASAEWAETAPLGRFELVGSSLYRLGSTQHGAFVDRFDLEVRR